MIKDARPEISEPTEHRLEDDVDRGSSDIENEEPKKVVLNMEQKLVIKKAFDMFDKEGNGTIVVTQRK